MLALAITYLLPAYQLTEFGRQGKQMRNHSVPNSHLQRMQFGNYV